ncbi:MAG: tetratricopeptide repeat protein, partial [Ekhidna sp.]|nr:tetratricopeptide repeat protein [Ekhidna sp.]
YSKAVKIYELEESKENWLHLDSMMGLAMAYRKTNQTEKAEELLQNAIAMEPQYYWAKSVLAKMKKS